MRLPWLQVNEDGFTRARSLAALLGISENEALGLVLRLWRWALEMAPAGDFSGGVPDAEFLAVSVGWPREKVSTLLCELQRVGLIATTPSLRVRGLDRYERAWAKNSRKHPNSGGRVPETGTNPALTRQMSARKTETETEKKKGAPASRPPREEDEVCRVFKEVMGAEYLWAGAKDGSAFHELRKLASLEEVLSRWRVGLKATGWNQVATVAQLRQKWNELAKLAEDDKPRSKFLR